MNETLLATASISFTGETQYFSNTKFQVPGVAKLTSDLKTWIIRVHKEGASREKTFRPDMEDLQMKKGNTRQIVEAGQTDISNFCNLRMTKHLLRCIPKQNMISCVQFDKLLSSTQRSWKRERHNSIKFVRPIHFIDIVNMGNDISDRSLIVT